ncbi:MAG: aminodeoxychorismate/anthranilate synthase component II [Chitinispirillaceae bacterium]|nr:aminodeoxychorismate/anthranilate synthase component II [Chitinispirillaceae bacterium]
MILMIDNYDSFTYNLVQYLGEIADEQIQVFRNNAISIQEIKDLKPDSIIISPGPCTPREAGISVDVIRQLGKDIPILGVCLGHQSIGFAFGGNVIRAPYLMHGKVSDIIHNQQGVFRDMPLPFTATRYHSLIIERSSCPDCLEITAETEDKLIMGVRHREYPIYGVQFHPESILTEKGKILLGTFLSLTK